MKKHNLKAVFFDLDGLMLDTEKLNLKLGQASAKQFNTKITKDWWINNCTGLGAKLMYKNVTEKFNLKVTEKVFWEVGLKVREDYLKKHGLKTKKGLFSLLKYLKNADIKTYIVSSSTLAQIKLLLSYAKISESYITDIIACDNIKNVKPDPETYLTSLNVAKVNAEDALALEDSDVGVQAATSANIKTIWVPDIKPIPKKIEALAYAKAKNLNVVKDIINQQF